MTAANPNRPAPAKQNPLPIQRFQFTKEDFTTDEGVARFNTMMSQHVTAVQALQGSGGRTVIQSGLDVQGETVTGLGAPQNESDAVSLGHAQANYSPASTAASFDLGGSNALKGLTNLQIVSNTNAPLIASIPAIKAQLAVGISGTITLAKLTGGGTNGSITVVKGIITAFVNPT